MPYQILWYCAELRDGAYCGDALFAQGFLALEFVGWLI